MLVAVALSGSLAAQGPEKIHEKCLACRAHHSDSVYHSGPLGGVARSLATATT
jgi:hypothetical protein